MVGPKWMVADRLVLAYHVKIMVQSGHLISEEELLMSPEPQALMIAQEWIHHPLPRK